ncbi:MAG: hypothetical protein GTN74_06740 [Proteobacteria bacterium]|nr:hypothetical protein [Pseudomonadota bacterium]NIS69286.1 hypothetical protein [Pseudomonadota bacterium]
MATVIEIEQKKRRKRQRIDHDSARKASALLRVFECASCYLKCSRCGVRLEATRHSIVTRTNLSDSAIPAMKILVNFKRESIVAKKTTSTGTTKSG